MLSSSQIREVVPESPCVKEARLYEKLDNDYVRCNVCARRCVIPPGKRGMCQVRQNFNGTLYVFSYGNLSSVAVDPIEKKPFFHFWPGSGVLTMGSWSCNFLCPWCQNYEISKVSPVYQCRFVSPERIIQIAKHNDAKGVAFSYNEPLVSMFEFSIDVMKLARKEGLYTSYVTNGFFTPESLRALYEAGLQAMNIDIKGCDPKLAKYVGAPVEPVWLTAKEAKKLGIHVEITTLVIPGLNDDDECLRYIARRIYTDLGSDTPWHVTAYRPMYKSFEYGLTESTTVEHLLKARKIGLSEGLGYIYTGNVPGQEYENTYCPKCGELLIRRFGFTISEYNITPDKTCPKCGTHIPIVGEYSPTKRGWWIW